MGRVFVSHASADAELVDVFVDTLLRNGCDLGPDDIFQTSGEDTGIPSGEDLIATVRAEVGEATLVIAFVTPTYQTRPVCVAELGAAWSRSRRLIPLMLPGMPRTDLEGVLAGMTIRTLDDSATLHELHDRVKEATGVNVKAATWNRHKQRWLKALADLVKRVPVPESVSVADVEQLRQDLEGAQEALSEVEEENTRPRRDLEAVSKLKVTVRNDGWAHAFTQRPVQLVLRNTVTRKVHKLSLTSTRNWYAGATRMFSAPALKLPATMPAGTYELLLSIADPAGSLANRPEYAVHLANTGLWEPSTGWNRLQRTVEVR